MRPHVGPEVAYEFGTGDAHKLPLACNDAGKRRIPDASQRQENDYNVTVRQHIYVPAKVPAKLPGKCPAHLQHQL